MSDTLKKFVSEHRQEFDASEPGKDLWEKIDARMDVKNSSPISSNWLSKLKYLGLSVSVLVVTIYFITQYLNNSSANTLALHKKDSAMSYSPQGLKAEQNRLGLKVGERNTTKEIHNVAGNKNSRDITKHHTRSAPVSLLDRKKDSALRATSFETTLPDPEKIKPESSVSLLPDETGKATANSANEKKETHLAGNTKKTELYIPAEPEKQNSYTGTLYEGSSLCSILRAYRFPGKVSLDKGGGIRDGNTGFRTTIKTISCSNLENTANMKAVWLKGKTDKEITISVKKRFKNIVLVKPDGRELSPEAISHYYPGLGVISEYKGKYFNMVFKDKVELILFFKDVEAGDKIIIDDIIEAVVKNKP